MAFDYTIKGWPAQLTLVGNVYSVASCDQGDTGLVYAQAGAANPHITIHGVNKEGPSVWLRNPDVHVRVSHTKLYEYLGDKPNDFATPSGKKTTGAGSIDQTSTANALATAFYAAIKAL
jgi:hypothetical protein